MNKTNHITQDVHLAVEVLRRGGLIAIPTETVYGLACLASNSHAVEKVFLVKGRPKSHPLIVHVASVEQAQKWGVFNKHALQIAQAFWPGPLTLLVPRTSLVPNWVTGNRDTVAIRIPNHEVALQVLNILDDAIVAPSANKFGKVSPTSAEHVLDDLGSEVELILDGGPSSIGVESTIVECSHTIQILRPGAISDLDIEHIVRTKVSTKPTGLSRAPGMMESHYAPKAKVVLCDSSAQSLAIKEILITQGKTCLVIDENDQKHLATILYSMLRDADLLHVEVIIAVRSADTGIGRAINDRLKKASAQRPGSDSI